MLKHTLLSTEGILILEPTAALEVSDFQVVGAEVDAYLAEHGSLAGLMIAAPAFPGWANLEAAAEHLQFVKNHHRAIQRLAVVSDNWLLSALPGLASHLVHPVVKHFSAADYELALNWLKRGGDIAAAESKPESTSSTSGADR